MICLGCSRSLTSWKVRVDLRFSNLLNLVNMERGDGHQFFASAVCFGKPARRSGDLGHPICWRNEETWIASLRGFSSDLNGFFKFHAFQCISCLFVRPNKTRPRCFKLALNHPARCFIHFDIFS